MSSQTANVTHRSKSKLKSVKNQPALGTFIKECQKAGILLKELSKLAESKKSTNNKRQRQPTGDPSVHSGENKKKPLQTVFLNPKTRAEINPPSSLKMTVKNFAAKCQESTYYKN